MAITERDTCRKYVLPKLQAAGWDDDPHLLQEEKSFTDGRIVVAGSGSAKRRKRKRADYLLRYTRDFMIAVVEAKAAYKDARDGLQQAKDYAQILGLKFAYATNGKEVIEFDFLTGREGVVTAFPTPEELMQRLIDAGEVDKDRLDELITPFHLFSSYQPRYYQELAVNRAVASILNGHKRNLLTMATGTGKTVVAFQICWKLWSAGWNADGAPRKPRILYLADRNVLVDDPKDKTFAPFGDARHKIANGEVVKSREMYFAIYQAIAKDENRPGLYREFDPDFFDLIIVDEAHRGSARDESSWREVLNYFKPAYQLGMTATPLRQDNRDTYLYFGNPIYTYTLRQGIDDGFLAPYRVRRIVLDVDATGWRPTPGEIDRYGREIPDDLYDTPDFERALALRARTEAIARRVTDFLRATDRYSKTIIFCVDQEHASEMRAAINNLNADLVKDHPDYAVRITADEGDVGRGKLSQFQEVDSLVPVVVTTSQLLTTGVDVPTCRNIVIARVVNQMTDFKQILGRGTRVREDYGKLYFNVLDFTGSATKLFADPEFDGEPAFVTEEEIDAHGEVVNEEVVEDNACEGVDEPTGQDSIADDDEGEPTKYYVDGGHFQVATEAVYELGPDGRRRSVVAYPDFAAKQIRVAATEDELRVAWRTSGTRQELIDQLGQRGVDVDQLQDACDVPDADPLDLLVHVGWGAALHERRERADRALKDLDGAERALSVEAREILAEIIEKYALYGVEQFELPNVLQVPPISEKGNVSEIASLFGGAQLLRDAVERVQHLIYA